MFWPHLGYKLILRKCAFFSLCLFITPSFRSLMSDVSKVIQLYAEQWEGNYNITQYVHQGSYQRRRSPFVAFYSSVYRGPSHFHSPLLCVTVFGQRCYSVTEQKWYLTGNFMSMLFWSAVCCIACECVGVWVCGCACVWHMADTLSGDCGRQSDLLPLTQASQPASLEGLR